jgi:hypothetical protein
MAGLTVSCFAVVDTRSASAVLDSSIYFSGGPEELSRGSTELEVVLDVYLEIVEVTMSTRAVLSLPN